MHFLYVCPPFMIKVDNYLDFDPEELAMSLIYIKPKNQKRYLYHFFMDFMSTHFMNANQTAIVYSFRY